MVSLINQGYKVQLLWFDGQLYKPGFTRFSLSVSMVSKLYKSGLQGSASLCPWSASFINQGYQVQLLWVHGQLYKPGLQGSASPGPWSAL
ncbi:hypothetical protein PoB_007410700 [Plakobranchus ocellatus]|uniref:Uncharacterized protein n=1 Tax=Plakobranchus ocellatus TaxID=259542 RepID=A0AAV4DUB1_9GAST|nr:hypothetical protein PoB_007410700 [Plakobranchus ocellatus]